MPVFEFAERLKQLPPYLFKEIDRVKDEVRARGSILSTWGSATRICPHQALSLTPCTRRFLIPAPIAILPTPA